MIIEGIWKVRDIPVSPFPTSRSKCVLFLSERRVLHFI